MSLKDLIRNDTIFNSRLGKAEVIGFDKGQLVCRLVDDATDALKGSEFTVNPLSGRDRNGNCWDVY